MCTFFENKVYNILDNVETELNLNEVISMSQGMYVKEIYSALESYIRKNKKNKKIAQKVFLEMSLPFNYKKYVEIINKSKYLPIPHILDSDWRFTVESAKYLVDTINNNISKGKVNLVLIGTPSLFLMLNSDYSNNNLNTLLIEKNDIKYFNNINYNIITNDVSKVTLEDYADVIVCDPPWYMDVITKFIESAQKMLRINSKLILVVPPEGVREGIQEEYKKIICKAEELGFKYCSFIKETVSYVSPPFEVKALEVKNITNYPIDWRKGSLMIFEKKDNKVIDNIESNQKTHTIWKEAVISNVRFKVKCEKIDQKENIYHLIENDIYPTVSMRNDLCNSVNVWTSGNRIYSCNDTFLFYRIINQISKIGKLTDKYLDEIDGNLDEKRDYYNLIAHIVNVEREEYAKIWD